MNDCTFAVRKVTKTIGTVMDERRMDSDDLRVKEFASILVGPCRWVPPILNLRIRNPSERGIDARGYLGASSQLYPNFITHHNIASASCILSHHLPCICYHS
jgi:hypothetical protein